MHSLESPNSLAPHPGWCDAAHCTVGTGLAGLHRSRPASWPMTGDYYQVDVARVAAEEQPTNEPLYILVLTPLEHDGSAINLHFSQTDTTSLYASFLQLATLP
jgi:hypothetical protein